MVGVNLRSMGLPYESITHVFKVKGSQGQCMWFCQTADYLMSWLYDMPFSFRNAKYDVFVNLTMYCSFCDLHCYIVKGSEHTKWSSFWKQYSLPHFFLAFIVTSGYCRARMFMLEILKNKRVKMDYDSISTWSSFQTKLELVELLGVPPEEFQCALATISIVVWPPSHLIWLTTLLAYYCLCLCFFSNDQQIAVDDFHICDMLKIYYT